MAMEPLNLRAALPSHVRMRSKTNAPASMPKWYENSPNALLADDCRAKCSDCRGHGSHAGAELETCQGCHSQDFPCPLHRCKSCAGSGLVCPACRGMRFVRVAPWDIRRGGVVEIERCTQCCEGNNVNPATERRAITRYMTRWLSLHPSDTPEEYAERQAAKRAEQEAANAEWWAQYGTPAGGLPKRERWKKLAPMPVFRQWEGSDV